MITPNETASLLIQALPYIRRFTGKTLVLKVGGLPMTDPDRARSLAQDVLLLHSVGIRPVLVHGGGPQIDDLMRKLGKSPVPGWPARHRCYRISSAWCVGKINRELVSALNALEPVAVGVAGEDGRLLEAASVDPKLGFVGKVSTVRAGLLHALLDDGLVPIVSTVGSDASGQPYNINADDAARAIAVAMGAEKLVYLTGAPGLLDNPGDPSTLVHSLTPAEARERIGAAGVSGGMIPKLAACAEAVEGGVASAHLIDGRAEHAILIELFTDSGIGTMVREEVE